MFTPCRARRVGLYTLSSCITIMHLDGMNFLAIDTWLAPYLVRLNGDARNPTLSRSKLYSANFFGRNFARELKRRTSHSSLPATPSSEKRIRSDRWKDSLARTMNLFRSEFEAPFNLVILRSGISELRMNA